MIEKQEIESKAEEFGIHVSNVERDYVFGWLLCGIYSGPLGNILVLKGGNAFRKAYFANTRFSNDLDFSTTAAINVPAFIAELNGICDFVQAKSGVNFDKSRSRIDEKQQSDNERKIYEARLYFSDFYGNPHTISISVRMDFTQFDRIYLPVQERFLIHPYSDGELCKASVKCQKLEELLATKLKCLLQRRHSFDLYDYIYSIFINKDIAVDRGEIVRTFLKKTIFEPSPGVARGLLLDLPLEVFRVIWSKYIICPKESLIDFDTAISRFKENVLQLFGGFQVDHYGQIAFFPSNLRNIIMEAASNLTLLELTYDGYTRRVEPYSLVFKRRRDGFGQEYFYAFDQTGGNRGPGIKAFLHPKIQNLRNTNISFEPRLPVELSRAGEFAARSYFSSSVGQFAPRARRVVHRTSRIYIVECAYCGKHFPRKKYSTLIRRHRDRYGNLCYGRSGFIAY